MCTSTRQTKLHVSFSSPKSNLATRPLSLHSSSPYSKQPWLHLRLAFALDLIDQPNLRPRSIGWRKSYSRGVLLQVQRHNIEFPLIWLLKSGLFISGKVRRNPSVSAMAAPFFSTPFQPYIYQSPQDAMIPFQILGGEAQVVQIMLKPQEKIIAKPGSLCFMSGSIEMENSYLPENEVGLWQWLFGKTITSIVLRNSGPTDGFVGIAAPYFARILPIDLAMFNGEILCQPDAFLCSVNDVKVSNTVDQRGRNVVAGAEGFLRQKLSGQGLAFILAGGSVVQKNLEIGEVLAVDVSCIAAVTSSVNVQIKYNGPARKAVFGRDNAVTALLTGPGIVFIQSLPFHRFSQRIARAVTAPNMRENPRLFIQIAIFLFLAYVVIVSSLVLTDV